jgi:hypothetical protein
MIIHAKEQFYLNANGLLDENSNNPKAFWSLVKKVMGNCISFTSSSFMSSTSKENGVRRGKFGGSILFAVEDIEQT